MGSRTEKMWRRSAISIAENTLYEKRETEKPHLDVRDDFTDQLELLMRLDLLLDFLDELVGRVELIERLDCFAREF